MTGQECLEKIQYLHKKVEKYQEDIERYRTLAEKSNSGDIIPMPTSVTQSREALFTRYLDIIAEIEKGKGEIEEELEGLKDKAKEVMEKIQDHDCKLIMIFKYIRGNTITEISKMIYISEAGCWRKLKQGKREFCRFWH